MQISDSIKFKKFGHKLTLTKYHTNAMSYSNIFIFLDING